MPEDDDVKTCLHCSKKLRSDNTIGICKACNIDGKADANGLTRSQRAAAKKNGTAPAPRAARVKPPPPVEGDAGEGLATFRTVAEALGKDPDVLLASFAAAWLEQLRDSMADD